MFRTLARLVNSNLLVTNKRTKGTDSARHASLLGTKRFTSLIGEPGEGGGGRWTTKMKRLKSLRCTQQNWFKMKFRPYCRSRCPADDHYVYGGDRCEQRAEKLDLSSNTIIAIAAGTGGGLVFILSVALAVTCFRRRRRSEKEKLHDADRKSE